MDRIIDLRSDTVTRPTPAMREAMATAEVGDDVYGEDPTINLLEEEGAALLGTEAALFVTSGTQANLLALLCHCRRGDEYLAGADAHCYRFEGGGGAVLGGIQPQPVSFSADGTLDLAEVERAIKPDDPHFARTRLICLENTQAGKVLPQEYLQAVSRFARENALALHLDGARLFNAAVRQGLPAGAIARHFDSVSICLSKGLGAPAGSLLCGTTDFIRTARRWRKMVGGGMRQGGILAAAGLVALSSHIPRLAEDHENARLLADGLAGFDLLGVDPESVQTNMVFLTPPVPTGKALTHFLAKKRILIGGSDTLRLVTHLDVTRSDIHAVIAAVRDFFGNQ